jgi:hypothetical protein
MQRVEGYSLPTCRDRGLFHKATSSVMTGENSSQNDMNDWSLFHITTSDKRLINCNKVTGKFEPLDKCLFHEDIFFSQSLVFVELLLTEVASKVRLVTFRGLCGTVG